MEIHYLTDALFLLSYRLVVKVRTVRRRVYTFSFIIPLLPAQNAAQVLSKKNITFKQVSGTVLMRFYGCHRFDGRASTPWNTLSHPLSLYRLTVHPLVYRRLQILEEEWMDH